MAMLEFVQMVARLETADEHVASRDVPLGPPGVDMRGGVDPDWANSNIEALDSLIVKAREIEKRRAIPARNFVEGGWSFRRSEMREGGPGGPLRGICFAILRKGDRSDYGVKFSIYQAGNGWIIHPRNGYAEAFMTFADAKDRALKCLNATEGC